MIGSDQQLEFALTGHSDLHIHGEDAELLTTLLGQGHKELAAAPLNNQYLVLKSHCRPQRLPA